MMVEPVLSKGKRYGEVICAKPKKVYKRTRTRSTKTALTTLHVSINVMEFSRVK